MNNYINNSNIEPTDDGIALFSSKHKGAFGKLLREEGTIGDMLLDKKKPAILFKILKLFDKLK